MLNPGGQNNQTVVNKGDISYFPNSIKSCLRNQHIIKEQDIFIDTFYRGQQKIRSLFTLRICVVENCRFYSLKKKYIQPLITSSVADFNIDHHKA